MTFVYRHVALEELRAALPASAHVPPALPPGGWAVDDARNAKLICWGGRGYSKDRIDNPPDQYLLIWNGVPITFGVWETLSGKGNVTLYELEVVELGRMPGVPEQDLMAIVREALAVHYAGLSSGGAVTVDVRFSTTGSAA